MSPPRASSNWPLRKDLERDERKGAIETAAQEQHVRALAGATSQESDARAARVLGCLLGGAVGDAFGYAIEFDHWPAIQRKYGSCGLQEPVLSNGQLLVSDDSQMTLFTLEALNMTLPTQRNVATEIMLRPLMAACQHAYLRWGDTQGARSVDLYDDGPRAQLFQRPAMRHRRAPGNTCLAAVRAGALGTCDAPINDSKGCGAAMRTAPIGLMRSASPQLALELGCMAGALTHGHVDGWLPAGVVAAVVRLLIDGESLEHAVEQALALGEQTIEGRDTATPRLARAALRLSCEPMQAPIPYATLGEGWTGEEALAIAVYAVAATSTFEEAIRLAANHSGDSDSTASIAGQLCGARDGILAVPHSWVRRLDVLPEALMLARDSMALDSAAQTSWGDEI